MANGHGGARPGGGRPSKTDEEKVRNQSVQAIEARYGSVQDGLLALLDSGEPSLIKFVYEHAIGKPKEKVELSSDPDQVPIININVVRKEKEIDEDKTDSL